MSLNSHEPLLFLKQQDNKTIHTRRGEYENKEPHFTGFLSRTSTQKQSVIFPLEELKIKNNIGKWQWGVSVL